MRNNLKELVEELARVEHLRWAGWQKYLHDSCEENEDGSLTIPKDLVNRWSEQIKTPYEELSEKEKQSDRKEVYRTMDEIHKKHVILDKKTYDALCG